MGTFYIHSIFNIVIIIIINILRLKYKKIILITIFSLLIISLAVQFLIDVIENNSNNIIIVNSDEIINNFVKNGTHAIKDYNGKIIEIKGIIAEKSSPKDFRPLWDASALYFGDFNDEFRISCYFNNIIDNECEIGQEIIVRCKFKKYTNFEYKNNIKHIIEFRKGKIMK
jgi:hypothetical protein